MFCIFEIIFDSILFDLIWLTVSLSEQLSVAYLFLIAAFITSVDSKREQSALGYRWLEPLGVMVAQLKDLSSKHLTEVLQSAAVCR